MRKDIDLQKYQDRLEYELSVIEDAGLSGYMLIVKDYVEYANKNGIPTGHWKRLSRRSFSIIFGRNYKD